jgi:hypothetical protein
MVAGGLRKVEMMEGAVKPGVADLVTLLRSFRRHPQLVEEVSDQCAGTGFLKWRDWSRRSESLIFVTDQYGRLVDFTEHKMRRDRQRARCGAEVCSGKFSIMRLPL